MRTKEQRIARARQAVLNLTRAIEDVKADGGDTSDYERALVKEQATLVKLLDTGGCDGPTGPCKLDLGHQGDHRRC